MEHQRWLKVFRIITAVLIIVGFILLFSDIKGKLPSSLYNFFTFFQFLPSLLKFITIPGLLTAGFLLIIVLTLLTGRTYCSFLCPLGILQDGIGVVRRWLPLRKKRARYSKPLNYIRYPLLALTILSLFFTGILGLNLLDPYANFGRIITNLYQPLFIAGRNMLSEVLIRFDIYAVHPVAQKFYQPLPLFISLTILLLILVMVFFRGRLYCNSICPVGTTLGLLSRVSLFKIKIGNACTKCGSCQKVCKAGCIDIRNMRVDESRCVACFNCIDVCPESGIGFRRTGLKTAPVRQNNSRRNFLKAGLFFSGAFPLLAQARDIHGEDHVCYYSRGPVSPPGSLSIQHLKDRCIACQLCVSVCTGKVLQPAVLDYGFTGMMVPKMDFEKGFCNYGCTKCGEVCPSGAILRLSRKEKKLTQIGKVYFNRNICIVKTEETACGSCSEHCPTQAVYMVPYKDSLTIPEVNPEICVGCGACEYACPVDDPHAAIYVVANKIHSISKKQQQIKVEETTQDEFPF